jgi:hypothetical protein
MATSMRPVTPPSPETRPVHPRAEIAVLWLEALLAVGAYGGAIAFALGGIDLGEAMARLPFGSPVFAGVALGLVNGVLPTVVLIGALRRRPWANLGHTVVGLALMGWIVTQVLVLGPPLHPIQALYFAWGWAILALATWLRLRR